MIRPLYASVLDTVRVQTADLAAAKTILMLHALAPNPVALATIHAINHRLVIGGCIESDAFLDLVRGGRVRFCLLPDGTGPRRELIRRLDFERYLGAWPELYEDGRCPGNLIKQYASKAQEFLSDEAHRSAHAKTGSDALDKRLYHAREFFRAIETAGATETAEAPKERLRRDEFERQVRAIPASLERNGASPLLVSFVKALLKHDISGRAAIYDRIQAHDLPGSLSSKEADALRAAAMDAIDDANDSAVAYSLASRLLNCRQRTFETGPEFLQSGAPRPAEIVARPLDRQQLHEFASFSLDWEHVRTVLSPRGHSDGKLEGAFARLVPVLAAFDLEKSGVRQKLVLGAFAADTVFGAAGLVELPEKLGGAGLVVQLLGALVAQQPLLFGVAVTLSALLASTEMKGVCASVNAKVAAFREPRVEAQLTRMRGWLDLQ